MSADTGSRPSAWDGPTALGLEDLFVELRRRMAGAQQSQERLSALLDAVVAVSSDLDLATVLSRIVESARTLLGARYGALGVIDDSGTRLSEFVVAGMSEQDRARVGDPPAGHGILGLLLREPHTQRIGDIRAHPASVGYPPGHPPMRTFLGTPIRVRDHVFGNLYLTDKIATDPLDPGTDDGQFTEFTDDDEAVVAALAAAAGIAIENAQLYRRARRNQDWAQAVGELTQTLLEGRNERSALLRMLKRARELGGADLGMLAVMDEHDDLVVRAVEGISGGAEGAIGQVLTGARWQQLVRSRVPLLVMDAPGDLPDAEFLAEIRTRLGRSTYGVTAIVPITVGEVEVGLITLTWGIDHQGEAAEMLEVLTSFGEQMGLALEASRAQRQRARTTVLEDRERIARDMHDHVIQRLFATGLSLRVAARSSEGAVRDRIEDAVDELDAAVKDIRRAIFELHHAIPEGGLGPELESVVEGAAAGLGFVPDVTFEGLLGDVPVALEAEVLAVVREALANVARHAQATDADVRVSTLDGLAITVRDNGIGMNPEQARSGLVNLRDRAEGRGGTFALTRRDPLGTQLVWTVPLEPPVRRTPPVIDEFDGAAPV